MRALGIGLAALLLAGCVSEVSANGQAASSPSPTTTSPSPTEEQETPTPSTGAQPCEDVMFQRAQDTIRAQQAALANSDFETARTYASNNFRSSVSVEQFQVIIEGSYAFLLENPDITFVDCQRRNESALIRVEVAGSPVTIMLHGLVLENESWFIDAASVAGIRDDVTT
jgi:hypothetical protein